MSITRYCSSTTKALANVIRGGQSVPRRMRKMTVVFKEVDEEVLDEENEDEEDEEDNNVTAMRLGWVLGQLHTLHYLKLRVSKLLWVPPLLQLRHLSLSFGNGMSASLGAELCLLTNLQTVLLYKLYTPDEDWMETLDLRPLTQLRSASLCDVFCNNLHLPPDCRLHLDLTELSGSAWSGALASVQSLKWGAFRYAEMSSLPPFCLAQACNLHWLYLFCEQIGSEDEKSMILERELLKITDLYISSASVHLQLPTRSALKELVIDTRDLTLSCDDIGAFLDGTESFSIQYMFTRGHFLIDLCLAMAARSMAFSLSTPFSKRTLLQYNRSGVHDTALKCPCGCCDECLG